MDKKKLSMGLLLMAAFAVVFVMIFSPIFPGKDKKVNGLDYLDNLYNTISKGSAYYIPKLQEEIKAFNGKAVDITISMPSDKVAAQAVQVLTAAGATASASGKSVKAAGDWGKILAGSLADSDLMYKNDGKALLAKYPGISEKTALYTWWQILKSSEKALNDQKNFPEAKIGNNVMQRAVECSYNFYGIEGQKIMDSIGLVVFSLLFYVIYTVWYGFSIMFIFEGVGMRLEH